MLEQSMVLPTAVSLYFWLFILSVRICHKFTKYSRRSDCVSLPNNIMETALKRQSPFSLLLSAASRLSASVTSSGMSDVPSSLRGRSL